LNNTDKKTPSAVPQQMISDKSIGRFPFFFFFYQPIYYHKRVRLSSKKNAHGFCGIGVG
jgi:hypothetical protein